MLNTGWKRPSAGTFERRFFGKTLTYYVYARIFPKNLRPNLPRSRAFDVYVVGLLLLVGSLFTLSGCSHVQQDGAPNFYVDERKVPDAVPKCEPLAKYGNMRSYYARGKRYYVLRSSKNYEATGTASWYGTRFHRVRTSSGERYNMLAMTAAHKTLPLPTYLEVTNLKNGRKVIVKVNDRGPFHGNRIIDLSYVAAKKLHMMGHGTTVVHIKAIDPATYREHLWFGSNRQLAHRHKKIPRHFARN
ncbi:MAG TPA: septal ring lytic transglycosylase RlpA family protein [Gammaproteobacteria bacterium]|jgi:rare lipoprotein A|nr:septal ring lytic transglycosylase RlpA family protein [Gammaproteobacteria bacterium]